MKTRIAIAAVAALAVILPASLEAGQNGGSAYSRYGIGDLRHTISPRLAGMGGTGTAVRLSGGINDLNPASWSRIPKVLFTAAALYEGFRTTDGENSAYLAGVAFNGLALAVPVDSAAGVTLGVGLAPVSRVNYDVTGPVNQDGFAYTLARTGEGGVSRAFVGSSVTPARGLSLGAEFDFYFGSNRYILNQEFATGYAGATQTRIEHFRGPGAAFGLLYDGLGDLLGLPEGRGMALGLSLATGSRANVSTERVIDYAADPANTPSDTLGGGEGKFRIPLSVSGGVSYAARNFLAAADVRFQDWSEAQFETTDLVTLTSRLRVSAGVEFTKDAPATASPARSFRYSFGGYYDLGYLDVGGDRIAEKGIAAGLSFVIFNETRLSLAASAGMRGSTDGILQEDKIFRISASMDITEMWFQRPEEE